MTLAFPVRCSTDCAMKPSKLGAGQFVGFMDENAEEVEKGRMETSNSTCSLIQCSDKTRFASLQPCDRTTSQRHRMDL